MNETQINNKTIDDKIIMTLAMVYLYEEAKHKMIDKEILALGGLAKTAEELESQGLLLAGYMHKGKILENKSYTTTITGMKVLTEYISAQTGKPIPTVDVSEAYSV
jgi:hypothetical protein